MPINPTLMYAIQYSDKSYPCSGSINRLHDNTVKLNKGDFCVKIHGRGTVTFTIWKHWNYFDHNLLQDGNYDISNDISDADRNEIRAILNRY